MKPMISVIIPCYNHGAYIRETVDSVLRQTFKEYEIIIVDDGSTDEGTLQVLDDIQNNHPEIRIIHQKNGHLSNARNAGIRAAQGEFFLPLDSDDTIEPEMLEMCHEEIKKDPSIGFIYTYVHFFGDFDMIWKNQEYNFYDLLFFNHPTVCALVRKKAWEEVGGYDEDMKNGYEDWEFWIALGEKGWFGKVVKKNLFNYRKHGISMVTNARKKHEIIVEYIKEKHKLLYDKKNINEIRKKWKPIHKALWQRLNREASTFGLKLELIGIFDKESWKRHPFRMIGRLVPIRIKKRINSLIGKNILDTTYFDNRSQ